MSDSEWGRGIRWSHPSPLGGLGYPGAPDRGRAPRTAASPLKWVSEDRRSPAARWGAWASKIRLGFRPDRYGLAAQQAADPQHLRDRPRLERTARRRVRRVA